MFVHTQEYEEDARRCWERYVAGGEELLPGEGGIRPEILESWRRSREYGVDVNGAEDCRLSPEELERALAENAALMSVANPYMENIFNFVEGSNYVIHLTDRNGCVLRLLVNDEQIQDLIRNQERMDVGSVRNERTAGTNSTSLCLVLQKPVQVYGAEHYMKRSQFFFCCSAPIFGEEGELVGVLTMFGPKKLYQAHTLGMVCAAADGIQRGVQMQRAYDKLAISNQLLGSAIESVDSSVIILDAQGRVVQVNHNAEKLFRLAGKDMVGHPLSWLIKLSAIPGHIQPFESGVRDIGFTLLTASGRKIDITLSTSIVRDKQGQVQMIVMFLQEQTAIHQFVSRVSGYTASYTFESIVGDSEAINSVRLLGRSAAKSDSNVLILGESGCGKELLAQSIHNASSRAEGPFVAVNCGSIPKNLIESELFGYEGGAFTGARKEGQPGKFELAHGGTLFLDEIGDMPLELQVTLLRVLQSRQVTRIGGKYQKKIDVRVIAATNCSLLEAVRAKEFRSDLYYRLNVFNIVMPPLRERPEDILLLARHFIRLYSDSMNKGVRYLDEQVQRILVRCPWPGNVRELENVIERAINLAQTDTITVDELSRELLEQQEEPVLAAPAAFPASRERQGALTEEELPPPSSPEIREYRRIVEALRRERGHVASAAGDLQMPVRQLYRKIKKYSIQVEKFRVWD